MINLKRVGILGSVLLLGACSYFDTGEGMDITSEVFNPAPVIDAQSVENIIYRQTRGAVQIFNLDMGEQELADSFVTLDRPIDEISTGLIMNPSVEIYPIDISMQNTLKP